MMSASYVATKRGVVAADNVIFKELVTGGAMSAMVCSVLKNERARRKLVFGSRWGWQVQVF